MKKQKKKTQFETLGFASADSMLVGVGRPAASRRPPAFGVNK